MFSLDITGTEAGVGFKESVDMRDATVAEFKWAGGTATGADDMTCLPVPGSDTGSFVCVDGANTSSLLSFFVFPAVLTPSGS
jgi:hypothetical protein